MKTLISIMLFLLSFVSLAQTTKLPVSAYGELPYVSQPRISPDGKKIAYLRNVQGYLVLYVFDLTTQKDYPIAKTDNLEVYLNWFEWGNKDNLIYSVGTTLVERTIKYSISRLYKFDLAGKKEPELLIKQRKDDRLEAQFQDDVISFMPDKPNKILVQVAFEVVNKPSVYEVDIESKQRSKRIRGKNSVDSWIADRQGNVRIAYNLDETTVSYQLYDQNKGRFTPLFSYEVFSADEVNVIGFDKDPNIIYVTAYHNDKKALFKVDLNDAKLTKQLVFADPEYDFDGSLLYSSSTGEVIGFSHSNADDNRVYWSEAHQKLQRSLNHALPDFTNVVIDTSTDENNYLVYSSGKGNAGMYLVGDRKAKDITFFGARYPEIDDTNYAGKQLVSFKARDGVVIEGYLTLPKQADNKALATVILPHGGPMARDYGGFDYWSEMLANQGYAVLQPNFRGSSGYGHSFESAAINGWGAAMQDDLQDAAHWMIEKGYTDANRICVVGASYGGYAALMALAKHPETFKCAASFAGVTDLEHIVKRARWFTNKEVVRKQFGTDSEKLEAASPVNLAAKINRPVLLIHGTDDKVVPVLHSREMLDELEDEGKPVKYVELDGGNHHLSYQPHRLTTLTEIVSFLQQHL